jgi:pimeloyl-ACP methyl ester carboxylesterase/DNA-binding CsgD family transcriptional regulator
MAREALMNPPNAPREKVRFCHGSDGVRIAFAVHGTGPPLILGKHWISHLQYDWDDPLLGHLLDALGRIATVVRFDERGYGLSDWNPEDFSLEARVGDLKAVAAAAGFERYAVMAMGQAGQVAISYAAHHPECVSRLILNSTYAGVSDEYRETFEEYFQTLVQIVRFGWTHHDSRFRRVFSESMAPGATENQKRWLDELQPLVTSTETAIAAAQARQQADVTNLLADVGVPTLVLHTRGNRMGPIEQGRQMAAEIPGAHFVPLDSENMSPLADESAWGTWLGEVTEFLAPDRASNPSYTPRSEPVEQLTEREIELMHLVADGLTNVEIAEQMMLSPRTVERHLSNIYRKLRVSGRAGRAAAVAQCNAT